MYENLTVADAAAFSAVNDFFLVMGIALGFIISGFLKHIFNIFANRFERPRKVKVSINSDRYEYFYLLEGKYYQKQDYKILLEKRRNSSRYIKNPNYGK